MNVKPGQTTSGFSFDVTFTKNGVEVQPNGSVTVKIPVPEALKGRNLNVFRVENGKYVNMNAKYEDEYLIFDTNHFSIYVVTAEDLANDGSSDNTSTQPSEPVNSDNFGATASEPAADDANPDTGAAAVAEAAGVAALVGAAVLVVRRKRN